MIAALLLMSLASAETEDARRPFYVIAHCANNASRVDAAVAAGANGVEIDVMYRRGALLGLHGGFEPRECGARTPAAALGALFEQVATAMHDGELALVIIDAKRTGSEGETYGKLLGRALADAGLPADRVVVSVPLEHGESVRSGLLAVDYDTHLDLYLGNYGKTDPARWMHDLDVAGADVSGVGMDPIAFWRPMRWWRPWMQEMIDRRDDGTGPGFAYYWTINRARSAQEVLDYGLDGLITNHPQRVMPLLDSPPNRERVRLATTSDRIPR